MKITFTFLITFFLVTISTAQITDSTKIITKIDSVKVIKLIDSISIDTLKISDFITIKKSLLDSLLKPFYSVKIDTLVNDTIYVSRYRLTVNPLTKDTIYIPLPKSKTHIISKKILIIDTLKINNTVQSVTIDTTKFAKKPVWWKHKNNIGLDISEAAFVNWSAGGNNSVSGLLKISFVQSYKKLHLMWNNEIFARYGLNQQEETGLRKTDDELKVNSTFGYRKDTISNWYYSVKFNFDTQFTDGYKYPETSTPISRFFAPAYLFLGIGSQYELKKNQFSIYLSPITLKSTFVLDDDLSNDGAFGVIKGKKSRHEFGGLIQSTWETEVAKNIMMNNRLSLYSDYLNSFGNIDVDWELNFKLTINKHIKANIGTHLIYDDDIKYKDDINNDGELETLSARIQLKQLLSIGVLFSF